MGFSPDLVAGVYVGFDTPKTLGAKESGSSTAAPIFRDFMKEALAGEDKVPFRIPENVTLSPVNRVTGEPSYIGAPEFILEAFRPGTEPRLGALKSTIRIGGGADTFVGTGFDFEDDLEAEEEAAQEEGDRTAENASSRTSASESAGVISQDGESATSDAKDIPEAGRRKNGDAKIAQGDQNTDGNDGVGAGAQAGITEVESGDEAGAGAVVKEKPEDSGLGDRADIQTKPVSPRQAPDADEDIDDGLY